MIKVYLDWNVIAQMKGGYLDDLLNILMDNDKFIIPYSTSHIGDISSSYSENEEQKKRIEFDLQFISSLTKNYCLLNTKEEIILKETNPAILLQERIEERELFNNFSLETLEKIFSEDELTKGIGKTLVELIKSIPLDDAFKDAFENTESSEYLNKLFPEFKDNPTMEGFFNSIGKLIYNLNEKEDYKILREITQNGLGIKRDKIFNDENPYKFIEGAHEKLGATIDYGIDNSKNAPEWFNEISNEYIKLDMHGYQEDTIRVKENKRKETFKNTTEDSFHAAFASTCNFYIINDNKSYKKTRQVFEKLEINTLVFKPAEFIEYYQKFLKIENLADHYKIAVELLKSDNFIESNIENNLFRTYIFPYFIFDFFNKIIVLISESDKNPTIMLGQLLPSNNKVTYLMEVEKLVTDLNNLFGCDIDNLGDVIINEFSTNDWIGRKWKIDDINLRLIRANGHFQLYFDL